MKPKKDQLDVAEAYATDQVPDWWDAEPTHEQLVAAEIDSQRHQEHISRLPEESKWIADATKKGPKPF
jgi:hypothetical protein